MTERSIWEGRPIEEWRLLLRASVLEVHDSLGSTNDRAKRLAAEGAAAFTTVIADEQTAGRGRAGSTWESRRGLGLWMSIVTPAGTGTGPLLHPLITGLALARALERAAPGSAPRIKWPNDVLLGGRKVAGVLCERTGTGPVIVGTGVNLLHDPGDFPPELRDRATSVAMRTGAKVSPGTLAVLIHEELRPLIEDVGDALSHAAHRDLAARDALLGRPIRTTTGARGIGCGIDAQGQLNLQLGNGSVVTVRAGGVFLDASGRTHSS